MKIARELLLILIISVSPIISQSQDESDSLLQKATLADCIQYALAHQPSVQQSLINEKIANQEIKIQLADWFPQINFNFNFQHNFVLPTTIFQGNPIHIGLVNTSDAQLYASQTIFSRDVLLASSTAGDVRRQAEQTTAVNKINVIVNVSKAYYAVLITQDQIDLVNQDIARLQQSFNDSYNQYKSGVVDKTDYMQATIALNNAKAELRQDEEQIKTSYANLKEVMGYPPGGEINLNYDMTKMETDINFDTTETLIYQNRTEYKLLQTQMRLQEANLDYYIWSFIPSLSAFGAYNLNFENNQFSNLYKKDYPSSYIGLQLSFPIFQGAKRIQQIEQAKLELNLIDYDQAALQNSINTEYIQAMANYKSNLNNFRIQKDNLKLAKDVYNIIELQYKSGIKTYLDVITAETNLRTTQVNYLNALYQVLISKTDLQKALGTIKY
jgi:outer membrane protein